MSPDARFGQGTGDDDVVLPFDDGQLEPDLAALDAELARAGGRLRKRAAHEGRERPSAAFTNSLRDRLLAQAAEPLGKPDADAGAHTGAGAHADAGAAPRAGTSPRAGDRAPERWDLEPAARPVRGHIARRTPTVLPAPRWSALAVAAVLVVALFGANAGHLFDGPATVRITDAVGASLVRGGTTSPLAPETALLEGDGVSVTTDGHATIRLGGGVIRLAGGAAITLTDTTGDVTVEQMGRAWHRVSLPEGRSYTVATGALRWTALGTAFDINRIPRGLGEHVTLIAVEHAVQLAGPEIGLRVDEGRMAQVTVLESSDVAVSAATTDALADPWMLANAGLDREAGFTVGAMTAVLAGHTASPTPEPSAVPATDAPATPSPDTGSPDPSASAAPVVTPGATATPRPTTRPTPKPTAAPTPKPTAKPIGTLTAEGIACGPTALISWNGYGGGAFDHFTVLRSTSTFAVPAKVPTTGTVTALGGSSTTDAGSGLYGDAIGTGVGRWYRVLAFDAANRTIAASPAFKVTGGALDSIGPFTATPVVDGVEASWSAYGGAAACFSYYKVSWSATSTDPSYLGDNDGATPFGGAEVTSGVVTPGAGTWYMRVEAILNTGADRFIIGRSEVASVTFP